MYILYIILIVTVIGHRIRNRQLIVPGPIVDVEETPYAVAILSCSKRTTGSTLCAHFCSGTLIAPSVVLTAGHCIHATSSRFNDSQPPVALENMYVMVGTADPRTDSKDGQQLVKVKSVANLGYGLNVRYQTDKDMGVIHLEECVELIPGQVETIPVATLDSEILPTHDTCVSINIFGFGRSTNLPSEIADSDGMLRRIEDTLHPFEVCLDSFVYGSATLQGFPMSVLDSPGNKAIKDFYYSYITSENQLCHGGNSMHASCLGDSGSGIISPDHTVVGVTSFGLGPFCGFGPDYIARVASHADWILEQLQSTSVVCPDWKVEDSFASWPVTSMDEADLSSSRCLSSSWQCGSGECISLASVCNGVSDCPDGSDESRSFCPETTVTKSSQGRLTDDQADAASELDDLISQWEATNGSDARLLSEQTEGSVVVVGSLESVSRPTVPSMVLNRNLSAKKGKDGKGHDNDKGKSHGKGKGHGGKDKTNGVEDGAESRESNSSNGSFMETGENDDEKLDNTGSDGDDQETPDSEVEDTANDDFNSSNDVEDSTEEAGSEESSSQQDFDCPSLAESLLDLIIYEKSSGNNRVEEDPSSLLSTCNHYTTACGSWEFCSKFQTFIISRNQAIQYLQDFDAMFNNTCAAPESAQGIPEQLPTNFAKVTSDLTTAAPTEDATTSIAATTTRTIRSTESTTKSVALTTIAVFIILICL